MKTIYEKSIDYAEINEDENCNNSKNFDKFDIAKAFREGVECAEYWISVEDELPEEQGYYLVIAPHSFPKNCNVVVAEFYEDNNTFYSESSDSPITDATHWRPIELK